MLKPGDLVKFKPGFGYNDDVAIVICYGGSYRSVCWWCLLRGGVSDTLTSAAEYFLEKAC